MIILHKHDHVQSYNKHINIFINIVFKGEHATYKFCMTQNASSSLIFL
jgi:hypothetical protein